MKKGSGVRMKPSGIGGMAVMEGVMMKNKDVYAVAVRKPNNEIAIEKNTHKDISDKVKLFKLPVFRGILAFVDSMVVGMKVLNYSASFFEDEDEAQTRKKNEKSNKNKEIKTEKSNVDYKDEVSATQSDSDSLKNKVSEENISTDAKKDEKSNALLMVFAVLISIALSVTLFMVLPVFITGLFSKIVKSDILLTLIEGIIRLSIFIGYVLLASMMPEIKRVFMYHGAEHKTINCLENGFELTVENVKWQSKQHKRCGTSFMLLVILISLVFFMILPVKGIGWKVLSRILLVPFIAGISYEFIRLAGKSESKLVHIISQPGLWMQGLTTKEPDDSMIEVAIQSVGAVFDWKAFLETSATTETKTKDTKITDTAKTTKSKVAIHETIKKQEVAPKQDAVTKAGTATTHNDLGKRNTGTVPVQFKSVVPSKAEEEDDEILKALDKFFDLSQKETGKSGEN
jgi:uncharacterized protein YqhQ